MGIYKKKIINKLEDKDAYLFKLRHGLMDNKVYSLTEISLMLNLSHFFQANDLAKLRQQQLAQRIPPIFIVSFLILLLNSSYRQYRALIFH
jgi:uncharacterized membrane protein YadS